MAQKLKNEHLEDLVDYIKTAYSLDLTMHHESHQSYLLFINGRRMGESMSMKECWKVLVFLYDITTRKMLKNNLRGGSNNEQ